MSRKEARERLASGAVDETARATEDAGADATDVDLGEDQTIATEPNSGERIWSQDEIAELARNFEGDTDRHKARAAGDPVLVRLIANLGRRSKPPSGPIPERASSDGGDYVAYGATAAPPSPRDEPTIGPKVLVQGSDEATALLPGRRRSQWIRRMLTVAKPLLLVVLGAGAGAIGYRWAETPEKAPIGSSVLDHPPGSLIPAGPRLDPPQGSLSVSGVQRPAASASASAEPGASAGHSSPTSSANRAPVRVVSPPPAKRTLDAPGPKAGGNATTDDLMEPVGY